MSDGGLDQEDAVRFIELVYRAGYRLERGIDDIDPGYEYAIQQLCSELELMGVANEDASLRAMQAAQEHVYGEARGEDSRPLSEFGVTVDE